ncbi:MAG: c-type cytochrome [Acidobacteriota bacterium]|nr:MAG: c-type cytochrome [Acidobacteriota bacterium]
MKKLLKIALVVVVLAGVGFAAFIGYVVTFLPDIPLEEVRIEYTHERIKRGEYLAKSVAQCLDCHSERDWSKFSGPIKPGTEGAGGERFDQSMGFPGSYTAPNLTPHNIKDWTDAELFRAITAGVSRDGRPLFPIMPYPNYGKMDREDIYSIIAYIRKLPPVESETPPSSSDFPMSIIIHAIPSAPSFVQKPPRTDKVKYGAYLSNAAGCAECHTPAKSGQTIPELLFSGGRYIDTNTASVQTSNITPDKETGIGAWSEQDFIARFKAFDKTSGMYKEDAVKEGDFNTPMPWQGYATMSEEDLAAIYAYLMSIKPIKNKVPKQHSIPRKKN